MARSPRTRFGRGPPGVGRARRPEVPAARCPSPMAGRGLDPPDERTREDRVREPGGQTTRAIRAIFRPCNPPASSIIDRDLAPLVSPHPKTTGIECFHAGYAVAGQQVRTALQPPRSPASPGNPSMEESSGRGWHVFRSCRGDCRVPPDGSGIRSAWPEARQRWTPVSHSSATNGRPSASRSSSSWSTPGPMALRSAIAEVLDALPAELHDERQARALAVLPGGHHRASAATSPRSERDLTQKIRLAEEAADRCGVGLFWAGTHPFSPWHDQQITPNAALPGAGRADAGDGAAAGDLRPARPRRGRQRRQGDHGLRPDP